MPHLTALKWDFADQLKSSEKEGETTHYVYSGGERVRKVVMNTSGEEPFVKYERIYLGAYELYREYTPEEDLYHQRNTHHVLDTQRKIALLEVKTLHEGEEVAEPTAIVRYQYTNHLDSACLELDENAEILSYEEYHPFGTTSYSLHTNDSEVSLKRYKYVHKERDDESGLYYYGARYYAPWLCRFVSVDPLKDKYPYKSTFDYAENRPISGIDLDGLEYVTRIYNQSGEHLRDIIYYTKSDEELKELGGTPKGNYYAAGFGPEGKGIKHVYLDSGGEELPKETRWDLRQEGFMGEIEAHGLYSGPGSISKDQEKNYDFSWEPIDRPDAIAKEHDINYQEATNIPGFGSTYLGYTEDTRTLEADKLMVSQLNKFLLEAFMDQFMLRPTAKETIAPESILTAISQKKFISILADYKEFKVRYMKANNLDPNDPSDILKVSLQDFDVKRAYIFSSPNIKENLYNLSVLLGSYSDPKEQYESIENIEIYENNN